MASRKTIYNAVLIPLEESTGRILVQDRRGHKPPPWGFFGGGIESGETPRQALMREIGEELSFRLEGEPLTDLGTVWGQTQTLSFTLCAFAWSFGGDLTQFVQNEGAGMALITPDEMLKRTEPGGPDYMLTRLIKDRITDKLTDKI